MRSTIVGILFLAGICAAQEAPETQRIEFQVGDEIRSLELYVPAGIDGNEPLPLVFDLHGSGSTPEQQIRLSGMSVLAERDGFLLAEGRAAYIRPDGTRTWNADLDPDGVSDVDYIVAAIEAVNKHFEVDRNRVYSTGMSGGGRMTSRLACELADTLAAVAPVAGVQFGKNCNPSRPIPLITFHSEDDRVNTYVGGNKERNPSWVAGVEGAIESWVEAGRCNAEPVAKSASEKVTKITYADCADNTSIVFYSLVDGGHSWPGTPIADLLFERRGNRTNMDINASELIWAFFEAHSL